LIGLPAHRALRSFFFLPSLMKALIIPDPFLQTLVRQFFVFVKIILTRPYVPVPVKISADRRIAFYTSESEPLIDQNAPKYHAVKEA
jgi:hypothetical protein